MASESTEVVWLVRVTEPDQSSPRWLRHVGGDWGPEYLTTDNMMEAARFSSSSDVPVRFRTNGWGGHPVRPVRAYITTSIRVA